MARQLDLLPSPAAGDDWRLDPQTIASGRRGIALARAALAEAKARAAAERTTDEADHHRTAA